MHAHAADYLEGIASKLLDEGPRQPMIDAVEQLDHQSAALTPKETTVLARSGHPTVVDDGDTVYDRPPEVPRLSEDELRAIHARGISIHHPRHR